MIGTSQRRAILSSRRSRADDLRALMGNYQGLFIDFTDDSSTIADLSTPANSYRGKAFDKLTVTRASTRKRFNSAGLLEDVASGLPAIDYDPIARTIRGLLIEGARTNLLLNSDSLSTQSVTVTAAVHTLSFYGTGTVTLSGASTAGPLTGSAAFPTRSTLTFTPSAGTLTLTVTGTVQYAQLELGAIPSSYIPTAGATVTRAAENCTLAASLFPASAQGPYTIFVKGITPPYTAGDSNRAIFGLGDGTTNENRYLDRNGTTGNVVPSNVAGGSFNFTLTAQTPGALVPFKAAVRYALNSGNWAYNGTIATDDTTCALPAAPSALTLGNLRSGGGNHWHGWIQQIAVIPVALTNAQLQAVTA